MAIKHPFHSAVADGTDTSLVRPSNWNADHTIEAGSIAHSDLTGLTSGDDHTQYQKESEKGAANGYASLDSGILVPIAQLPTGTGASQVALGNHTHGAGGGVATDTIFDAKGDLAVGTGADTAARLAVGSNTQVLTADSTQSTGLKWATAASGSAWTEITKSSDQTVSASTTQTADSELTFTLAASSLYVVQFWIMYTSSDASGDYAAQFLAAANMVMEGTYSHKDTTNSAQILSQQRDASTWPSAVIGCASGPAGTDRRMLQGQLMVYNKQVSTTTLTYTFACNVAAGDAITRAGSMLRYRKQTP